MRTRRLGSTELHLTTIGLGTWAIGGPWEYGWGAQDDADSISTIHRALDLGINWIDTAPAYGLGHSEEIVGEAIKGRRHEISLATKCGLVWDGGNWNVTNRLTGDSVRAECEASLKRLGVDVIDLYQIHWPVPDEALEDAWSTMASLVQAGKVRHIGASNFSLDQLRRVQSIHPVASLQPPYSMLERTVERELLDCCAANDIGVVAYSPMQAGMLTGKYTPERVAQLAQDDWRRRSRHFKEPELAANLNLVEDLRAVAERHGQTLAQLSIAWVLRRSEVTAAIVGARQADQIEDTAPAADWELSAADIAEIDKLLTKREHALV